MENCVVNPGCQLGRGGSGRRGVSGGMGLPLSASRSASVGLGLGPLNGFGNRAGSGYATGNFTTPKKLSSDVRFMQSTSMSSGHGGLAFPGGRLTPMVRSSSQGGPGAMGSKRTRRKLGDATHTNNNQIRTSHSVNWP